MSHKIAHIPLDFPRTASMCGAEGGTRAGKLERRNFVDHASVTVESIANRERCTIRKVNMTISLALVAPNLVRAAIEGRVPRGMGIARLVDAPAEWSRQHQMLGLAVD